MTDLCRYKLTVREFNNKDSTRRCKHPYNSEDAEMDLNYLVKEIERIETINNVHRDKFVLTLSLKEHQSKSELKELMSSYFEELHCMLKPVSLELMEE